MTVLLHLVEWEYPNGRSGWDNVREVVLHPDRTIRSKAPTHGNRHATAEMFPDPIEAIASGEMIAISREEFDRYWNAPVKKGPGLLTKIRSLLHSAR